MNGKVRGGGGGVGGGENAKIKKKFSKSELFWYQNVPHVLTKKICLPTLDVFVHK